MYTANSSRNNRNIMFDNDKLLFIKQITMIKIKYVKLTRTCLRFH